MTEQERWAQRMQAFREHAMYEASGGDRARAMREGRDLEKDKTSRRLRWLWWMLSVLAASGLLTR